MKKIATIAAVAVGVTACDAQSAVPGGLKCNLTATMTTSAADKPPQVKSMDTQSVIKFSGNYWRVVSQDGKPTSGDTMSSMRVTDDFYILREPSDETETRAGASIRFISAGLTVNRKTGEYSMTMDGEMPAHGVRLNTTVNGRCDPIIFDATAK
jgi:hypothetical protein